MSKKTKKAKQPRVPTKLNQQIPLSLVRKVTTIGSPFLELARDQPIFGCWIMAGWRNAGISPVVVARQQGAGKVMFGVYMVDLFCLGVKNVFTRTDYSLARFERELPRFCANAPEKITVELAHEVIYGALEFAEGFGFEPHRDFKVQMADLMLDPPDAHPRLDGVVFGKEGRPFYISGPYDDQRKIATVLSALGRTAGAGNFDYLAGFGGIDESFDDDDDDDLWFGLAEEEDDDEEDQDPV